MLLWWALYRGLIDVRELPVISTRDWSDESMWDLVHLALGDLDWLMLNIEYVVEITPLGHRVRGYLINENYSLKIIFEC